MYYVFVYTYIGADSESLTAEDMRARMERARQLQALISKFQQDADRLQSRVAPGKTLKSSVKELIQGDRGKEGEREWRAIKDSIEAMAVEPEKPKKTKKEYQPKSQPMAAAVPASAPPSAVPPGPMSMMEHFFKSFYPAAGMHHGGAYAQNQSRGPCNHCGGKHSTDRCWQLYPQLRPPKKQQ